MMPPKKDPPLRTCKDCFAVMVAALKTCPACEAPQGDPLTSWDRISRNEREIIVDGRYYFASRCNPSSLWVIEENTGPAASKPHIIRLIAAGLTTRDVTSYFRREADRLAKEALDKWAADEGKRCGR